MQNRAVVSKLPTVTQRQMWPVSLTQYYVSFPLFPLGGGESVCWGTSEYVFANVIFECPQTH